MTLEGRAAEEELPEFLWLDTDSTTAPISDGHTARPSKRHVPGETGLWIFVLGDMTLFGVMFVVLMWENHSARALFHSSAVEISQPIGFVNTLVLLVSSYLVVAATWAHRGDDHARAARFVIGGLGCALVFAMLKAVEYAQGIATGHTLGTDLFFTFYFVLTGVHLLHVAVGSGLLSAWWLALGRDRRWTTARNLFEGIAVYWHMVDLLWIAIFTLVYLVCAA